MTVRDCLRIARNVAVAALSVALLAPGFVGASLNPPMPWRAINGGSVSGCPSNWTTATITGNAPGLYLCEDPNGYYQLFNDSHAVWIVVDNDPGPHVLSFDYQTVTTRAFHAEVNEDDTTAYVAPREVIVMPLGYRSATLHIDQNLTAGWIAHTKVKTAVLHYLKKVGIKKITQGSKGRTALVTCGSAAWSDISGARQYNKTKDVQTLITNGIGALSSGTGCARSINAARGVEDSDTLTTLDDQAGKLAKEVHASQSVKSVIASVIEDASHEFHFHP